MAQVVQHPPEDHDVEGLAAEHLGQLVDRALHEAGMRSEQLRELREAVERRWKDVGRQSRSSRHGIRPGSRATVGGAYVQHAHACEVGGKATDVREPFNVATPGATTPSLSGSAGAIRCPVPPASAERGWDRPRALVRGSRAHHAATVALERTPSRRCSDRGTGAPRRRSNAGTRSGSNWVGAPAPRWRRGIDPRRGLRGPRTRSRLKTRREPFWYPFAHRATRLRRSRRRSHPFRSMACVSGLKTSARSVLQETVVLDHDPPGSSYRSPARSI